jgi:hypothetical protein
MRREGRDLGITWNHVNLGIRKKKIKKKGGLKFYWFSSFLWFLLVFTYVRVLY